LASTVPWSLILLLVWVLKKESRVRMLRHYTSKDGWRLYLFLWAISPLVFFTFASNILWTYVLPGLPAFALLTAELIIAGSRSPEIPLKAFAILRRGALAVLLLFSAGLGWIAMGYGPSARSQTAIITAYRDMSDDENEPLVYLFKRPYSADFYSHGKARLVNNIDELEEIAENRDRVYFAVRIKDMKRLPETFKGKNSIVLQTNRYYLLTIENHSQTGEDSMVAGRERM